MIEFKIGNRTLQFNPETKVLNYGEQQFLPDVRKYSDMKDLYSDPADIADDTGLYFMYRGIAFSDSDHSILEKHNIRFDITILIPQLFGDELNKTYGHFHPKNNSNKHFEEVYEVLYGDVRFLLQNSEEVYYTDATVGDAIIMKESYGHVSINQSSDDYMVMMDLVDDSFSSVYDDYSEKKGAAYYLKNGNWDKNPHYDSHTPLFEKTDKLNFSQNIYDEFVQFPEKFSFLK